MARSGYYEIAGRRRITSPLEEAIHDVLGGPVPAARALGVTRQSVHYWLQRGRLYNSLLAERIAAATARAGRRVPAEELLGLAPWCGADRRQEKETAA